MNQQLFYTIAGHTFVINTPDTTQTTAMLPSFDSFRIQGDAIQFSSDDPLNGILFCFSGNKRIEIPPISATDEMEFEGTFSQVYQTDESIYAVTRIGNAIHKMKVSKDWKTIDTDLTLLNSSEICFFNHFLVTAYGMASATRKTIKIHASVIEKDGKALIFLGTSGTGKSTHSRLWQEFVPGCSLLNDDEPIVRVLEDGRVRVYGAPWSGSTPCYRNSSAQVAAFVHLYQSPENRLTQVSALEAMASLMRSSSLFRSDSQNKQMVFETLSDILTDVPVYRLDCRPDREAVALTETLM